MKLEIVGASNFVNRMFEACGSYQWARELLKNSLEAGATRVELGIEWQAVARHRVYRRTVADDGCGMDPQELLRFFSTLGEGAKKIGGVHDNFGVGAKIAALPWNPDGVVVVSYRGGRGSMIWIYLDDDSGDYQLKEFWEHGRLTHVVDPARATIDGIRWGAVKPRWLGSHGTVVVLLGSEKHPDTVLGNPEGGEGSIEGLAVYLNSRFWDLTAVDVRVAELPGSDKTRWPTEPPAGGRPGEASRRIEGARYYLADVPAGSGRLAAGGILPLARGRVGAEWYLWQGGRPAVAPYAQKDGYIAVRYNGELFQLTSRKTHFRWFGVIESQVQQNLTIVLEPQHYLPHRSGGGRWGIHPDQSRNRLIFTGDGEKGVEIPLSEWGLEFAETMPKAIHEAIRQARGELEASIEDDSYRRRLQDRFGNRWSVPRLVQAEPDDLDATAARLRERNARIFDQTAPDGQESRRKRQKTVEVVRPEAVPKGDDAAVEREQPVDVPRIRFGRADDFERPWHLALWAPNDPDGPTVILNLDSPILQEAVEHHQEQYPDVYAEEIAKVVRQVFGEVAACKVAHAQKLTRQIPEQELDRDYRNEAALTVALMGLIAEESLLGHRLKQFGRKKGVA